MGRAEGTRGSRETRGGRSVTRGTMGKTRGFTRSTAGCQQGIRSQLKCSEAEAQFLLWFEELHVQREAF